MNAAPRSAFDPTKILGPYPLLAAFLLVIETLLGFWLFRAESSSERIFAGVLMAIIFGGFLYSVIRVGSQEKKSNTITPPGIGKVTPAADEVTTSQIESSGPELVVSPDRSYTVNRPPDDWLIRELTEMEWQSEALGIKDPAARELLVGSAGQTREILVFQTAVVGSLIPIPGKTTIDGVMMPTALETSLFTQLAIIPMNRAMRPFYVERPFEHNFFQAVSTLFATNVLTLRKQWSGTIPNSQRQQMTAEFQQTVRHATLNGVEVDELAYNMVLIGIKGDIRDYILVMKYPILSGAQDAKLTQDLQALQNLASSFRPVKVINSETILRELREKAQISSKEQLMKRAQDSFGTEFVILLYRLSGVDLEDPDNRLRAMKLLKPFRLLSDLIKLQDPEVLALWEALEKAEQGDASEFKVQLTHFIELAKSARETADSPASIDTSPKGHFANGPALSPPEESATG